MLRTLKSLKRGHSFNGIMDAETREDVTRSAPNSRMLYLNELEFESFEKHQLEG